MTNWLICFRGRSCLVAPLVGLWLWAVASVAQETTSDGAAASTPAPAVDLPAGHSQHGEIFNEGPRQRAYLMGATGNVSLSVTTSVPEAQQFFNQGLGQLHGFWYFEAERSFRQAAALDPECAMAYWGMAMANLENEKRGKGFIDEAVKRKAQAAPHRSGRLTESARRHAAAATVGCRDRELWRSSS
jgi:hypothetical protein